MPALNIPELLPESWAEGGSVFLFCLLLQYLEVEWEGIAWFWDASFLAGDLGGEMGGGWITPDFTVHDCASGFPFIFASTRFPLINAVRLMFRSLLLHVVHMCEVCRALWGASLIQNFHMWVMDWVLLMAGCYNFLLFRNPCLGAGLLGWATIETVEPRALPQCQTRSTRNTSIFATYKWCGHRLLYSCPSLPPAQAGGKWMFINLFLS